MPDRPDPDDRLNPEWTVGEFEEFFEGKQATVTDPSKDHAICDFCSAGIPFSANPRIGGYLADDILNREHPKWQAGVRAGEGARPLVPLAMYCEDCAVRLLYFPCRGFAEVRYFATLDEERVMSDVTVTDLSPRDDGIPYDPTEIHEKISGVSWEESMLMQAVGHEDHMWGPENLVTVLLSTVDGVDPRDLIRWDGSFDPKELGRARKHYKRFTEKMRREGHSRKAFRDHVRE